MRQRDTTRATLVAIIAAAALIAVAQTSWATPTTVTRDLGNGYIRVSDRLDAAKSIVTSKEKVSYDAYWRENDDEKQGCDTAAGAGEDCGTDCECCNACDCQCCCAVCCGLGPPAQLFPQSASGASITGWVQQGFTTNTHNPVNPGSPTTFGNFPVQPNYRNDEYQLNQIYLSLERQANTGGAGWDYGYRVDAMYGEDYFVVTSPGLEERPNGVQHWNTRAPFGSGLFQEGRLGVALPQFYAELAYNDVSVKFGHFYALTDYESVMAPNNFFYSHSYLFQYGGPRTHTGILARWDVNNQWAVQAGVVNGWNKVDATSDRPSAVGSIRWNSLDERTNVSLSAITGDENGTNPPFRGNRTLYNLVFSHEFGDWQYVLQHNNGFQDNAQSFFPVGIRNGSWYGISQYLFYDISEQWRAGARFEWFNDQTGTRVFNAGAHWYALTGGVNYRPCANVTIRPEVRWDWASFHTPAAGFDPFSNSTKDHQLLFGVDAIITY